VFRGICDAPGDDGAVDGCGQLTGAPSPQAIGDVPTASGSAAATNANGGIARVNLGKAVCRHDPIETATDDAAGITFADGIAFNLFE
jgi:hypothetical protein